MLNASHARGSLCTEGSQQIGGAGADIGHREIATLDCRRPAHNAAMKEILLAEAALQLPKALFIEARVSAHTVQLVGVAKAVVKDGLVDDGHAARLRQ